MNTWRVALTLAATLWLAACGGGRDSGADAARSPSTATQAAAALAARVPGGPPRRALSGAEAAAVDPADAADQLLDFAEVYYPEYFPEHAASATLEGYRYRQYSTGIYLAVREGQVFVLGGAFGSEVVAVGPLGQFITPRPRVLSGVCEQAGVVVGSFVTPAAAVRKNAAVTVAGCTGPLRGQVWRQTSGPPVALVSTVNQTLSFDPPAPGSYGFQVNFIDAVGNPRSQDLSLTVAAASGQALGLTVRASQSVRAGGKVSVRAWPTLPEGDSVKAVRWAQIEGPPVTLDTRSSRLALFTAPQVTRDTVLRLRATLYTTQGRIDGDEVLVLVEAHPQARADDEAAVWSDSHVDRVVPYLPSGRHAAVLQRCVYDPGTLAWGPGINTCLLAELPFLAQETGGGLPTVEQVMGRVLVSHDWLGRNFEAFLRTHDIHGDFRRMLNSVTAIVLSSAVRPSFYYPVTGAIYLDADNFWLTPEERDTINEAADYRSEFGSELQFADLWRYVKDGRDLFGYYDPRVRVTRTLDHVRDESVQVLYHELGHALDYLPPSVYRALHYGQDVWDSVGPRVGAGLLTSSTVSAVFPLQSRELADLSRVLYRGANATAAQRAYTPGQIGAWFEADLATDLYSYNTPREDTAMVLEEVMLQLRLGIRRDVAFVDPISAGLGASVVRWGQRGRVGDARLRPRVQAIVQALTPWLEAEALDRLAPPTLLRTGDTWSANLAPLAIPRQARPADAPPTLAEIWQAQQALQRMRESRHPRTLRLPPPGAR
ncbi:MAG: hypothetical protein HY855_09190 [Burkholderiales bacterium]|nr:hypothetical protein [Burkholderiales bacterium]